MNTVMQASKLMLPGQGNSFPVVGLTFTPKIMADDTSHGWVMHEISGVTGQGAPLHTHPWEETFYVLEGEMDVQVGMRKTVATTGALLHLPANLAHSFTIRSTTIRLLEIIPTFAAAFYQEVGEKVTTVPPDLVVFQEVCHKHNVRLLN